MVILKALLFAAIIGALFMIVCSILGVNNGSKFYIEPMDPIRWFNINGHYFELKLNIVEKYEKVTSKTLDYEQVLKIISKIFKSDPNKVLESVDTGTLVSRIEDHLKDEAGWNEDDENSEE